MPTRTVSPAPSGARTHSCSLVYLRSSGYMGCALPLGSVLCCRWWGCRWWESSVAARAGEPRGLRRPDGVHDDVLARLDRRVRALALEHLDHPAGDPQRRREGRGVADDLVRVRRGELLVV